MQDFTTCTWLTTATYKAGIYAWATERRPIQQVMVPHPRPDFVVPGMRVGCLPYEAFLKSDLQCFFSEDCLHQTATKISTSPPDQWPRVLSLVGLVNFTATSTVDDLLRRELVDHWHHVKSYAGYYNACVPIECVYRVERYKDVISVLTLIIGLYGGLSVVLRFVAPWIVVAVSFVRKKMCESAMPKNVSVELAEMTKGELNVTHAHN
jgi:hypothetical protein